MAADSGDIRQALRWEWLTITLHGAVTGLAAGMFLIVPIACESAEGWQFALVFGGILLGHILQAGIDTVVAAVQYDFFCALNR